MSRSKRHHQPKAGDKPLWFKEEVKQRLGKKKRRIRKEEALPEIPQPETINIEVLPCCGVASTFARRKKHEGTGKYLQDEWFCEKCRRDTPAWFVKAIREDKTGFVERIQKGVLANLTKKAIEQKVQPSDPKFQRQLVRIDAWRAGAKTAKDPFALCPYASDTEEYKWWSMGRDRGDEAAYRIQSKGLQPL